MSFIRRTIGRGLLLLVVAVPILVIGFFATISILLSHDYNTKAKALSEDLASIHFPLGYVTTSKSKADEGGPLGSTPVRIVNVNVPPGRTFNQVKYDLDTIAAGEQHVTDSDDPAFNYYLVLLHRGRTIKVYVRPYTAGPNDPIISLQLTAR
jgi:hypothetical protein